MLTFVVVWNIAVITLKKYMSAYRRVHVNMYFLNQEKGLYVDIQATTRNMKHL